MLQTLTGLISYNGVPFGSSAKSTASVTYVRDPSNRTITGMRIDLTVATTIVQTNDATVDELRTLLGRPRCPLLIIDNAFPVAVGNGPGSQQDIDFGPKPSELSWKPLGGGTAAELVWRCETTIPVTPGSGFALTAFDYQVSWDIGPGGFQVRTISGVFRVPVQTVGRLLPYTADSFRTVVLARFGKPGLGWERFSRFDLQNDKQSEFFQITDRQLESPNAYPPGVVDMDISHRVSWARTKWGIVVNRISGTVTVADGYGADWALAKFQEVANERIRIALDGRLRLEKDGSVVIDSIDAEERVHRMTHSFGVNYFFTGTGETPVNFLDAAGFGTPINKDWSAWEASMRDTGRSRGPQGLRGTAGLIWGTDRITDLEDPTPLAPLVTSEVASLATGRPGKRRNFFKAKCPKKDASWVRYSHEWSKVVHVADVAAARELGESDFSKKSEKPVFPGSVVTEQNNDGFVREGPTLRNSILKIWPPGWSPELWVLRGFGVRVCYRIDELPTAIEVEKGKHKLALIRGIVERIVEPTASGQLLHIGIFTGLYVASTRLKTPPEPYSYP